MSWQRPDWPRAAMGMRLKRPRQGRRSCGRAGRSFRITTFYRITNERVRVQHGLLGRDFDDVELIRIQDLDRSQGVLERMLAIGDVIIKSSDPSRPELVLENVPDPDKVHELLRTGMLEARKKFRYSVQEEM